MLSIERLTTCFHRTVLLTTVTFYWRSQTETPSHTRFLSFYARLRASLRASLRERSYAPPLISVDPREVIIYCMTDVNMYGGYAESCLHFLRLAESMLAFHRTRAQVETSNLPSLINVIKNDLYALKVIKVYLFKPNIDIMAQESHGYWGKHYCPKNGFLSDRFGFVISFTYVVSTCYMFWDYEIGLNRRETCQFKWFMASLSLLKVLQG